MIRELLIAVKSSSLSRNHYKSSLCFTGFSLRTSYEISNINFPLRKLHLTGPSSVSENFFLHTAIPKNWLQQIIFILRCTLRASYLAIVFAPSILTAPLVYYYPNDDWFKKYCNLVALTLETAGPTFIKLGQWASTRPDVFPVELCQTLRRLHDQVKPHSFAVTRQIIEKSFKRNLEKLFYSIEEEPIGSGCIAQVYKASLLSDREPVAIKVRRKGVIGLIEADLAIMKFVANIIDLFPDMKWLSLPEEVEQFADIMKKQLDLRFEAKNLKKFRENFKNTKYAHFPRPIENLISDEVLVEEFKNAIPMRHMIDCSNSELKTEISTLGLKSFLKMMILDNFIHSDLHPGNIMVELYEGKKKLDSDVSNLNFLRHVTPHLVFIDTGLVTVLDDKNLNNFIDLFTAVIDGDGALVAKLMVERSKLPKNYKLKENESYDTVDRKKLCYNYPEFERKMKNLIESVQKDTFRLANIYIGDVLGDVLNLVREHHVKIESDFTNLVVSIGILEGLGRQLSPDVDIFEAAKPFLRFRKTQFYVKKSGVFFKLAAYVEARSILLKSEEEEVYENTGLLFEM